MDTNNLLTDHKHFIEGLMKRFGVASLSHDDIEALKEPLKTWFKWGASGFDRAKQTYDVVSRCASFSGKRRHLDIGCGPGYLSTVFASHGYDSTGIDIGDLSQATENKLDNPHLNLQFCNIDVNSDDILSLGQFNVITIDNVIEHVESPSVLIARARQLITTDGVVYLVIPNAQSIGLFRSDPHYNLFGISLLDRKDGDAMLEALKFEGRYEVNNWFCKYDINNYKGIFAEYGFSAELVNNLLHSQDEIKWQTELFNKFDFESIKTQLHGELEKLRYQLPDLLYRKLEYITGIYLLELSYNYEFGKKNHVSDFVEKSFIPRYHLTSWFFILKPAPGARD